jgi:hypothetical protein
VIRLPMILLFGLLLSLSTWAQETDDAGAADDAAAADEPLVPDEPEPEPEPEFDETGLDEQGFANEDDDFDPTETIPTDQSIDFPTDI